MFPRLFCIPPPQAPSAFLFAANSVLLCRLRRPDGSSRQSHIFPDKQMENTHMPRKNHARVHSATAVADWKIVECQKHLLVIDVAGKILRLVSKPLRLKGKPRYKVPPDCDPAMW